MTGPTGMLDSRLPSAETATFQDQLRKVALPADGTDLVLLGNFEVENQWAAGYVQLPRLSAESSTAIVNRMDEFAVTLGDERSVVMVKASPDADYLHYLDALGFSLPTIHVIGSDDPAATVTQAALRDEFTLSRLRLLSGNGLRLLPHGVAGAETELARLSGMPLAAASAEICRTVNSKVYSRRLAERHELRQPPGGACTSGPELRTVCEQAQQLLTAGPVVIKEAFGVSGRGIAVIDSARRLQRLEKLIHNRAEEHGEKIAFCIESWLNKAVDLNYHFTVSRSGEVQLQEIKEAITESGVHKGHRCPARLSTAEVDAIERAAQVIGAELARDGYFGVVGVDALLDSDRVLYPIIEINARNNMSTYQLPAQQQFGVPDGLMMAKHYPVDPRRVTGFGELRAALGELLITRPGQSGVLVNNFATVTAALAVEAAGSQPMGRLYTLIFANDQAGADALDRATTRALEPMQAPA